MSLGFLDAGEEVVAEYCPRINLLEISDREIVHALREFDTLFERT